ncbi:MAG: YsnF/AvaK domain-containing protein [Nakamurella sp.]
MTAAPTPDDVIASHGADDVGTLDDGAATDNGWMTRSEERLNVTTERVATTRVRLRKRIVTEMHTITVPVSREELVIDREPITDAVGGELPAPGEQDLEIILSAERPVVTMETVAVERIRVSTRSVTEDQTITERVGKEQVELHEEPLQATPPTDGVSTGPLDVGAAPGADSSSHD